MGFPPWKRERIKLSLNAHLNRNGKPVLKLTAMAFAPLRSCQDAIQAIFLAICKKPKYALDADIAGCFDHINQEALLHKLNTYPALKQAIQAWLKAGMIDQGVFEPTSRGTPQGGVISPLLMNVALHGLETYVVQQLTRRVGKKSQQVKPTVVRYADDVRHLTQDEILLAEKRGSEEDDLWVTLPT